MWQGVLLYNIRNITKGGNHMGRNLEIDKATKAVREFTEALKTAIRNLRQQEDEKERLSKEKSDATSRN